MAIYTFIHNYSWECFRAIVFTDRRIRQQLFEVTGSNILPCKLLSRILLRLVVKRTVYLYWIIGHLGDRFISNCFFVFCCCQWIQKGVWLYEESKKSPQTATENITAELNSYRVAVNCKYSYIKVRSGQCFHTIAKSSIFIIAVIDAIIWQADA